MRPGASLPEHQLHQLVTKIQRETVRNIARDLVTSSAPFGQYLLNTRRVAFHLDADLLVQGATLASKDVIIL